MKIKKGLDLPIKGSPSSTIDHSKVVNHVAIIGPDYNGMKPTMHADVGTQVALGQLICEDKKNSGAKFTSPASGTVVAINRGEKRAFLSLVIKVEGDREITFDSLGDRKVADIETEQVKQTLIDSGMWTAFRTRPFSKTPQPGTKPSGIFVSTVDTRPLSANPSLIIEQNPESFRTGLEIIAKLTDGKVYLNKGPNQIIPGAESHFVETNTWEGPHPAGLDGTHIHNLLPVSMSRTVWTIGYQDVIAVGHLFRTGHIMTERYVALCGPAAESPRLLKTRLGACTAELIDGETKDATQDPRVISGSVLDGKRAVGQLGYLSRWSNQLTLLEEGKKREFFLTKGWLSPGLTKYSLTNSYFGRLIPGLKFDFTTTTNGSKRSMVPIGLYEKVMPLDIIPTYLLRALISHDTDTAQELGCLELDEEDLSLCTFVCPGKSEYGPLLRANLETIERDG